MFSNIKNIEDLINILGIKKTKLMSKNEIY